MWAVGNNNVVVSEEKHEVSFKVDFPSASGMVSHWNLVQHLMKKAATCPHQLEHIAGSLVCCLKVGKDGFPIAESPCVVLSMAVNDQDAVVFAQVEEVNAVRRITSLEDPCLSLPPFEAFHCDSPFQFF